MKALEWIDKLSDFIAKIGGFLVIGLVSVICYDVFARYLFRNPTSWAYDTALHFYAISYLIAGGWVLKERAHVKVDVIYNRFTPRTRSVINLILYLLFLFPLCYYFIKHGLNYSIHSFQIAEVSRSSPLHEPIWPLKMFIPLGFILLGLQGIVELCRDVKILKEGKS